MKRNWWKAGIVTALGIVLGMALAAEPGTAPGPKASPQAPAGQHAKMRGEPRLEVLAEMRGEPRLEVLAEVLGKSVEDLRAELQKGGMRALIEESGMDPVELERKVLEAELQRLDEDYRSGKLPELRYQSLKARLEARKLMLEGPSLAELVARSGGDVEALKAQLRALQEARIDQLIKLGVISQQQAEKLRTSLDEQVERMLNRPAGLNPPAGFGPREHAKAHGRGFRPMRRAHGPQERPAQPGDAPAQPGPAPAQPGH